jgi:hypothetical protein
MYQDGIKTFLVCLDVVNWACNWGLGIHASNYIVWVHREFRSGNRGQFQLASVRGHFSRFAIHTLVLKSYAPLNAAHLARAAHPLRYFGPTINSLEYVSPWVRESGLFSVLVFLFWVLCCGFLIVFRFFYVFYSGIMLVFFLCSPFIFFFDLKTLDF